jgi:purine-cytosine permease-like protein
MMLVGTVAAGLFHSSDVVFAVKKTSDAIFPGFGTIVLIVSLLTLLAVTTLNLYGASLTMLSVVDSLRPVRATLTKRVGAVVIAVVLSLVIAFSASANFLSQFGGFLGILLLLFTPWTAINLIDFYFVRHTTYSIREIFNPHGMYQRWSWRGLLAYIVGFGAMLPFADTSIFTGPAVKLLGGADISMLIGLAVSSVVYVLACRSLDVAAEARRAIACDRGMDPDAPEGIPYKAIHEK